MPRGCYRPAAGFKADWKELYIQQAPPDDPRGGLVAPIEGGLWLVSLIGGDGDYPPTDEAGFLAFARSLRSPALYEAIAGAEPLTPIMGQRATENRLRHYDRLERFPDGVVAVGDAVCAFNPVYGQGMTAAALGAEVLDRWLRGESWRRGPGRGRVFQHALARATATAWQLSTGADYGFRTTEGSPQGSGRAADRPLLRRGDADRHEAAVGPATAGRGVPPAPPPVGAVRPRRPGPPGVRPARGRRPARAPGRLGRPGRGTRRFADAAAIGVQPVEGEFADGQTTLIRTGRLAIVRRCRVRGAEPNRRPGAIRAWARV